MEHEDTCVQHVSHLIYLTYIIEGGSRVVPCNIVTFYLQRHMVLQLTGYVACGVFTGDVGCGVRFSGVALGACAARAYKQPWYGGCGGDGEKR